MNKFFLVLCFLLSMLSLQISCTYQTPEDETPKEMKVDSFKYLTPCMIDIIKNFSDYVKNDTIPLNDDYRIDMVVFLDIDSVRYYWIRTDAEDEREYILTDDCKLFCTIGGWGFRDERCNQEFYDRTWVLAWR